MGLSSNILWHQTKEQSFYEILKTKELRYSYCLERIIPEFHLAPIAFPMISVSDYPISEIGNNKWAYGNYSIGFTQEWGVKVGFSPVWYCSYGSRGLRQLDVLLKDALDNGSKGRYGAIMYLFALMKFNQAPLQKRGHSFNKYRFYDEREWRLVPYITETEQAEIMPFLTEDGYKQFKKNNGGNSLLRIGAKFQHDDIHYIIVEKEEDVKKTREIIGNRVHIFTKEEVVEDVIGVDHHDEILPSPELKDLEAAQRHLERLNIVFKEGLHKKSDE